MKKRITFIIAVVVIISFVFSQFTVSVCAANLTEEEAAQRGVDVFVAWQLLNYGNANYYIDDWKCPYERTVKERRSSALYQGMLAAWRVTTFNLSNEASYAEKEKGYYETVLYNILYDEASNSFIQTFSETGVDAMKKVNAGIKATGASAMKSATKFFNAMPATISSKNSPETIEQFAKYLKQTSDLKDALGLISDVGTLLSDCQDLGECINRMAKLQYIASSQNEMNEILSSMLYHQEVQTSEEFSDAFRDALTDFIGYTSPELTERDVNMILFANEGVEFGIKKAASAGDSAIVKAAGIYGLAVKSGQGLGKLTVDSLFDTSSSISAYYNLEAMYRFETALRATVAEKRSAFLNNPTPETARAFTNSLKLLYKTYIEGLDIYDKFLKKTYEEGAINQVFKGIKNEDYYKGKDSIQFLKKILKEKVEYNFSIAENHYYDYISTYDAEIAATADVERVQPILTDAVATTVRTQIEALNMSYGLSEINGSMTLQSDLTIYGDLTLTGGLNLAGHELVIYGDFTSGGMVKINKGTLNVMGSYRVYNMVMENDEDVVKVEKDFCVGFGEEVILSAGTMYIGGDFIQKFHKWHEFTFSPTGTHKVVLNGTERQNVTFDNRLCGFNLLDVQNPKGIKVDKTLRFTNLVSDKEALQIQSEGMLFYGGDFGGRDVIVTGDMIVSANEMDLNGQHLTVIGNLTQAGGTVRINKGTLNVMGSYRIAKEVKDSNGNVVWDNSDGKLIMDDDDDIVRVKGDFLTRAHPSYLNKGELSAGTMYIGGDFTQKSYDGYYSNFAPTGTHRVVLNGEKKQTVYFDSSYNWFNQLTTDNPRVVVNGSLTVKYMNADEPELHLISEGMIIEADDYYDLNGRTVTIEGDLTQTGGTIKINKGTLNVTGSYRIAEERKDSGGNVVWGASGGELVMDNDEDVVKVEGDFLTCASFDSLERLSAGTMYIGGDFSQKTYISKRNFSPIGTHKVVLNGIGKEKQHVSVESYDSSYINILQLTRDRDWYVFNPEPCWKTLIEATPKTVLEQLEDVNTADSANRIREEVQSIDSEELKQEMEKDTANTGVNRRIEVLESAIGKVIVDVESEVKEIHKEDVSIIGALLNDTDSNEVILRIGAPENKDVLPEQYDPDRSVLFSMALEGITDPEHLTVPVKVTLPVPDKIDPKALVVLHYASDGKQYDDVRTSIDQKNGKWYVSFVLDRFSDFAMTQKGGDADVLIGDVNRDGKVTNKDRTELSRYLAKWNGFDETKIDLKAADVNGDGKVTNKDRTVLSRYLAKWAGYDSLPHQL